MLSIQFSLLRKNTRRFLMYYYRQNLWRYRLGGKHMSGQTTPPVTSSCPQFQQKWQMVRAGIQNICAIRLLVARPQRPACMHQPLLNCRSKYTVLIGMACNCNSEGGSSATPLMSTTVSKAGEPFSVLSVFHLGRDFSILERDF